MNSTIVRSLISIRGRSGFPFRRFELDSLHQLLPSCVLSQSTSIVDLDVEAHLSYIPSFAHASESSNRIMASAVGRVAQQAGKAAGNVAKANKGGEDTVLKKGARRDPELYVC